MTMQSAQDAFTVVTIRPREARRTPISIAHVPEDLRRRYYGKTFTRRELEELGASFADDRAVVIFDGVEWLLNLSPEV
jgi:hypothetical protein